MFKAVFMRRPFFICYQTNTLKSESLFNNWMLIPGLEERT